MITIPNIPMVRFPEADSSGYIAYKAPDKHNDMPITRAIGRLCSGDTLCVPIGSPVPSLDAVILTADKNPYLAVTRLG